MPTSASLVHRYYDPATGQFLSVDPLVSQTGTPYAYVGGDPVNGADPTGLGPQWNFNPFASLEHAISAVGNAINNYAQSIVCGNLGLGNSWFASDIGCSSPAPSSSTCGSIAGVTGGNLNKKSAQYYKNADIDPEELKAEYGYRSNGDLRVESGTGRVYVGPRNGPPGQMEPTNYRIVSGKAIFDPPPETPFSDPLPEIFPEG